MRFPVILKYLHEKPLPRLPLWNPDDPRPRLFLPLYWIKVVEPTKTIPKDMVKFECHWQMSANDVREYLQKVYGIDVLDVRVEIVKGETIKHPEKKALVPPLDDRKFVYVHLKEGEFKFPVRFGKNTFGKAEKNKIDEQMKAQVSIKNKEKNKSRQMRLDIGGWFQ